MPWVSKQNKQSSLPPTNFLNVELLILTYFTEFLNPLFASWVSWETGWLGDHWDVFLGITSIKMWGEQDWAEGEVGLLMQSKRSLTWAHCVLWSWDQSSEMSWMEVRGLSLPTPLPQEQPTSKMAFGEDFPVTTFLRAPLLPPSEERVTLQSVFVLRVYWANSSVAAAWPFAASVPRA